MNDYKELVESLKLNSTCRILGNNCDWCYGLMGPNKKSECFELVNLLKYAAEAIEQLVKERDVLLQDHAAVCAKAEDEIAQLKKEIAALKYDYPELENTYF